MKKPLYQALIEANVEESLAMKAADNIPDDIATRTDILEAEKRFGEKLDENKDAITATRADLVTTRAELKVAISESEKKNGEAIAGLKTAIAESEKKYEKSMAELAWKLIGFQTALTGIIAGIFIAAMKLL